MTNAAIKWHGGKQYLAKRIIELMPPRAVNPNAPAADDTGWLHYVEPYFGGGAVLFTQDPEGISEVVNDLDYGLTRFWKVLANPELFARFQRHVEGMPVAARLFQDALEGLDCDDDVGAAVAFFVINRQSRQALGKDFATLTRNRTRRGMNELASAWLSAIEGLPEVHARLKRVVILNDDAVKVIRQQDGPRTLFYLDPPYMHETRTVAKAYEHEMGPEDHRDLLGTLSGIEGRFLLSGYRCALYDGIAEHAGWNRTDIEIDNKSGGGKKKQKRVESIWRNYQ
jgi:DNA adenine methylase